MFNKNCIQILLVVIFVLLTCTQCIMFNPPPYIELNPELTVKFLYSDEEYSDVAYNPYASSLYQVGDTIQVMWEIPYGDTDSTSTRWVYSLFDSSNPLLKSISPNQMLFPAVILSK
jgi:hypothetical protein